MSQSDARRVIEFVRANYVPYALDSFTVLDLAAELRVSKKTIYRWFGSKDAIINATVEAEMSNIIEMFGSAFPVGERNTSQLESSLHVLVSASIRINRRLGVLQRRRPDMWAVVKKLRDIQIIDPFREAANAGVASREVRRDIPIDALVELTVRAAERIVDEVNDPGLCADDLFRVLARGILTEPRTG